MRIELPPTAAPLSQSARVVAPAAKTLAVTRIDRFRRSTENDSPGCTLYTCTRGGYQVTRFYPVLQV